jgi:Zn-dependent peptidase ImmA (M78 family)
MIGDRMRQARLAAGMTLDEVAHEMGLLARPITKAGLSKYEKNKSAPGQAFLVTLGKVLKVKANYFLTEPSVSIAWLAFRKQAAMPKSRQEQVKAFAAQVVQSQLWLQRTLYPHEKPVFPKPQKVRSVEEAERASQKLRAEWKLGETPIVSLTGMVEEHGGIVVGHGGIEAEREFDGLAGWADQTIPITVVAADIPNDRVRFNLAHGLGHLLMDCAEVDAKEQENLAHRFASALIVPAAVIRHELGSRRRRVAMSEFALLKRKFGLSMQSLVHRAFDLGIIEGSQYRALYTQFSQFGWRKKEPAEYVGDEKPARLLQMALRALTEGIITRENAERLCPGCTTEMPGEALEGEERMSAFALRHLPRDQRDAILAAAAQRAENDYLRNRDLTDFEAFSEEDLNDPDEGAQ